MAKHNPNTPKQPKGPSQAKTIKGAENYVEKTLGYYDKMATRPIAEQIEAVKDEYDKIIEQELAIHELEEEKKKIIGNNVILKEKVKHLFLTGKFTQKQIAKMLYITPNTVWRILQEPDVKEAIAEYQREEDIIVTSALKALRLKALEKTAELIDGAKNEMVSAVLIRDVLDRTGHKPVDKKEVKVEMTYEERLAELAKGVVIEDANYEVINDNSQQINTEGEDTSDE